MNRADAGVPGSAAASVTVHAKSAAAVLREVEGTDRRSCPDAGACRPRSAIGDGRGALPVVVDAASCTEGLTHLLAKEEIRVMDTVAFVDAEVLPGLPAARRIPSLVVHPTCSSTQLGLDPALLRVAAAAAENVIQPEEWGCCAFAGDRGLLHPELTASATAAEARSLRTVHATAYA